MLTGMFAAACESTPAEPPPYAPREVVELDRWTVHESGERIGEVVKFEIRDPTGPIRFFRVLDRAGRWVGHATEQGRFSRRVPFEEREQDVGVWAMPRGVAKLLEAGAPVTLRPVAREADFDKR